MKRTSRSSTRTPTASSSTSPRRAGSAARSKLDVLVNLDVDDLEKAMGFYSAAFDLKAGRRFGDFAVEMLGASAPFYLLLKAAGTSATAAGNRRTYERHWTPVHLDFVVDDIDRSVAKAIAAGATLEQPA